MRKRPQESRELVKGAIGWQSMQRPWFLCLLCLSWALMSWHEVSLPQPPPEEESMLFSEWDWKASLKDSEHSSDSLIYPVAKSKTASGCGRGNYRNCGHSPTEFLHTDSTNHDSILGSWVLRKKSPGDVKWEGGSGIPICADTKAFISERERETRWALAGMEGRASVCRAQRTPKMATAISKI